MCYCALYHILPGHRLFDTKLWTMFYLAVEHELLGPVPYFTVPKDHELTVLRSCVSIFYCTLD